MEFTGGKELASQHFGSLAFLLVLLAGVIQARLGLLLTWSQEICVTGKTDCSWAVSGRGRLMVSLVGVTILHVLEQGPVPSFITPDQSQNYSYFALESGKPGNITEHASPLYMTSLKKFLYQDGAKGCVIQTIRKQQGQAGPPLFILRFRKHALK